MWEAVTGAVVGDTFIPGNAEVGLRLRVVATFLDNAGQRRDHHLGPDRPRGSTARSAGRAGQSC